MMGENRAESVGESAPQPRGCCRTKLTAEVESYQSGPRDGIETLLPWKYGNTSVRCLDVEHSHLRVRRSLRRQYVTLRERPPVAREVRGVYGRVERGIVGIVARVRVVLAHATVLVAVVFWRDRQRRIAKRPHEFEELVWRIETRNSAFGRLLGYHSVDDLRVLQRCGVVFVNLVFLRCEAGQNIIMRQTDIETVTNAERNRSKSSENARSAKLLLPHARVKRCDDARDGVRCVEWSSGDRLWNSLVVWWRRDPRTSRNGNKARMRFGSGLWNRVRSDGAWKRRR